MDQSSHNPAACHTGAVLGKTAWAADDVLDLSCDNLCGFAPDTNDAAQSIVAYRGGTTLNFAQIARIIPCFTAGSQIITPNGRIAVQDLRAGDRVLTRDNGFQTITWAGHKTMRIGALPVTDDMRPVLICRGALGPNMPERDMIVSPNHRMLVIGTSDRPVDGAERLVAAKHLAGQPSISFATMAKVTYIHFMCERHEIVSSDGAWTETFQPNDDSLQGIDAAQRVELLALFPELGTYAGRAAYGTARKLLPIAGAGFTPQQPRVSV